MTDAQEKRLSEIYNQYHDVLHDVIATYEVVNNEHPIEILNEVRSICYHIAKCYRNGATALNIDSHIQKAENHLNRAILDGFKYSCLGYQLRIREFKKENSKVIALLDNGMFLPKFKSLEKEAMKLYKNAKKTENQYDDVEKSFPLFEAAYIKYDELFTLIENEKSSGEIIRNIVECEYKKKFLISLIFNVIMGCATITSLIFAILPYC